MEEEPVSVTELAAFAETTENNEKPGEPREPGISGESGESGISGKSGKSGKPGTPAPTPEPDDFDLSDINVKPEMSREDIIAAAEAAAFNGES